MNSTDQTFATLLRPFGLTEGFTRVSTSSVLAFGIGLFVLVLFSRRNGSKLKCLDMDGVPMKELSISGSKAAILFQPYVITLKSAMFGGLTYKGFNLDRPVVSKQGEKLAHDEPYIIRSGKSREVVLHTAEHVREFLRNDAKDHFKPVGMGFGDYFYRYFDPAYTHNASLVMLPSFQNEVIKWLNTLKSDSLRSGVGRLVVHAPTSCKILPLRVIPQSFYGEAYDDDAYSKLVSVSKMQGQALKYAVTGRWQKYRWFNVLPTPSKRQLDQYHHEWQNFNLEILEKSRKKGLANPAEHVFKGVQPDDAMSLQQYLQTIDEMIFTNIDITASVLAFMLDKLAKHPDFQQKLYEEIVAQKAEKEFNLSEYVTRQTTLLHYLCLESIRLRPATCKDTLSQEASTLW
uniref:Cytochrome P450 hydroxylase n=1 Tax=Tolypocladium sp. 49Y TaxID=2789198 RepID=A0A7S8CVL0_9HYPO|nr:cytochrome P450 hydroxylase [Tolypocladium sp. 49Y]